MYSVNVKTREWQGIELHIVNLSESDLIRQIRPGIDGLIIEEGGKRATYLPSVWEQLATPEQFITELRRKAGLSGEGWHESTIVHRYTTEEFC